MSSDQYIQLPADSTGKKLRTYEKTVGSNTIQDQVVAINRDLGRTISAKLMISTPVMTGVATNPYYWFTLWNPSASGILVALKRLWLLTWAAAAAVYIPMEFNRLSGTAPSSGTQISTYVKKDTTLDGNGAAVVRHTGVTIGTLGAQFNAILSAGAAAQNPYIGGNLEWQPGDELILREGEGVSVRQNGAGDVDQRHVVIAEWDEFTGIVRP